MLCALLSPHQSIFLLPNMQKKRKKTRHTARKCLQAVNVSRQRKKKEQVCRREMLFATNLIMEMKCFGMAFYVKRKSMKCMSCDLHASVNKQNAIATICCLIFSSMVELRNGCCSIIAFCAGILSIEEPKNCNFPINPLKSSQHIQPSSLHPS